IDPVLEFPPGGLAPITGPHLAPVGPGLTPPIVVLPPQPISGPGRRPRKPQTPTLPKPGFPHGQPAPKDPLCGPNFNPPPPPCDYTHTTPGDENGNHQEDVQTCWYDCSGNPGDKSGNYPLVVPKGQKCDPKASFPRTTIR